MRLRAWAVPLLIVLLIVAACRSDVSQPQMRRPLETLPAGPQVMLLASDLQNTWDRIAGHELGSLLARLTPARELLSRTEVVELRLRIDSLEARSGANLRDDLVLNALGGRAALALYPGTADRGSHGLLLVGELGDPQRFRTALAALRRAAEDSTAAPADSAAWRAPRLRFSDDTLAGKPVLRLHADDGQSFVVLHENRLFLLGTSDDLVRGALAVQAGDSQSALRDPDFAAALAALGMHNLVVLNRNANRSGGPWAAQGLTWDRDGLHFEQMVRAAAADSPPPGGSSHRESLLRSIPDHVTLAAYGRVLGPGSLRELLQQVHAAAGREPNAGGAASDAPSPGGALAGATAAVAGRRGGIAAAASALQFLPFELPHDIAEWASGEMAAALFGAQPTQVAPVPDVALVVGVRDAERAQKCLQDLEGAFAALPLGKADRSFVDVSYGGRTFRTLAQPLFAVVSPSFLLDGDTMVLTSTRESMQQIIDTRRTGKRNLLGADAFRRFRGFVPDDARAVMYADQRRLHRVVQQLGRSAGMWGQTVARGVQELESMAALLEHFPAGAAYVERTPELVRVRGWMLEND